MGTRHLIAVYIDGEPKVAQYGQWDGYPSGQGLDVLAFLRAMDRDAFARKVRAAEWISDDEWRKRQVEFGIDPDSHWISSDIANARDRKYPECSRDTGAGILSLVSDSPPGIKLVNSIDFAGDGLFCEWAYVIDLDSGVFEVYSGFHKKPHTNGRFAEFARQGEYAPVCLVATYPLNALPDDKQFLLDCERPDEEDAA